MNKIIQSITYLGVGAVVLIILWWINNREPLVPHGIFLPSVAEIVKPAAFSPESILLYKTMPVATHLIGNINVAMHLKTISPEAEQQVMNYAIRLAADRGADGVVVNYFFAAQDEGSLVIYLRAQAIKKA